MMLPVFQKTCTFFLERERERESTWSFRCMRSRGYPINPIATGFERKS
jgi:hypothetical protein